MKRMAEPTASVSDLHPARGPARPRDVLGRQVPAVLPTIDFEVDLVARCARFPDGEEVRFTPHQWRLLAALVAAAPSPVTTTALAAQVFEPEDGKGEPDLAVLVTQLRRKLEPDPRAPRYFRTIGRSAYALDVSGDVQP
jgi:two-component system KDP operon response regulator KdpE